MPDELFSTSLATLDNIPYCGLPPTLDDLWTRFNFDPVLCSALIALALWQVARCSGAARIRALAGWGVAAIALMSPLCALSVSLFSARIGQHMLLLLVAAPLIASALPVASVRGAGARLTSSTIAVLVFLWLWHMPVPYEATFYHVWIYWCMHLTLFGSATWLWRELLRHPPEAALSAIAAGLFTSLQMSLLGALLSLAAHPLFTWHLTLTYVWGLSPMQDQQLGGVLMWLPGMVLFLWASLQSLHRLRHWLEDRYVRDERMT